MSLVQSLFQSFFESPVLGVLSCFVVFSCGVLFCAIVCSNAIVVVRFLDLF